MKGARAPIQQERVLIGEERVLIGEERVLIGEERGLIGEERVLIGEERGLIGEERGLIGEERGLIGEERVLIGEERGLIGEERVLIGEELGLIGEERVLIGEERGLIGEERVLIGEERGLIGQERGLIGQERGLIGQESALVREERGAARKKRGPGGEERSLLRRVARRSRGLGGARAMGGQGEPGNLRAAPAVPDMIPTRYLPRYAPELTLLRHDPGHLRRALAPAYWVLSPFHVQQPDDTTCGPTSAAVVLSALRALAGHAPPQVDAQALARFAGGPRPAGYTLAELAGLLDRGAEAVQVRAAVAAVHVEAPGEGGGAFRADLAALEDGRAFVIANFAVDPLLGAGDVGHFSPIGAYDAAADRALVLDTYRLAWEPYWAPVPLLLAAMAAVDPDSGRPRGYLRVVPR